MEEDDHRSTKVVSHRTLYTSNYPTMAPVATSDKSNGEANQVDTIVAQKEAASKVFNPFYSPPPDDGKNDDVYEYAQYKVRIMTLSGSFSIQFTKTYLALLA